MKLRDQIPPSENNLDSISQTEQQNLLTSPNRIHPPAHAKKIQQYLMPVSSKYPCRKNEIGDIFCRFPRQDGQLDL